jgi:hypothetical protein
MTVLHTGSTTKYAENWEGIFSGGKQKKPKARKLPVKAKATMKGGKKKRAKARA